ncbi:MAG: hypothetical protein MUE90_15420 [Thermoanaerobaculales bacterium]|nr:hypothetical protein [Thermoanaerobaculales bacterium]
MKTFCATATGAASPAASAAGSTAAASARWHHLRRPPPPRDIPPPPDLIELMLEAPRALDARALAPSKPREPP